MPGDARDVIVAIATPPGRGALAVVRLTGAGSIELAAQVFRGRKALSSVASHSIVHGKVCSPSGMTVDEVLLGVMRAPHTYTGEDSVELSCHGGHAAATSVLGILIQAGARQAGPGEFTKRAFLNGRLDLSQAEAVAHIVSAASQRALNASVRLLEGRLSEPIKQLREHLLHSMTQIEARLDFEDDLGGFDRQTLEHDLVKNASSLESLLRRCTAGRLLSEGGIAAIAGRANVGKSSIFNRIVGEDRAIVSAEPGTTRDYIEERVELNGVAATFVDGAGFVGAEDPIGREGEKKARMVLEKADAILLVFDASTELTDKDRELARLVAAKSVVPVANKVDLGEAWGWGQIQTEGLRGELIRTSAITGEGIDKAVSAVCKALGAESGASDEEIAATERQLDALRAAQSCLRNAAALVRQGETDELIACELGAAAERLGEITGETLAPEVLDRIFAAFCVGK